MRTEVFAFRDSMNIGQTVVSILRYYLVMSCRDMCHEVHTVVMSHEVATQLFSGEGHKVEVNKCHLTRHKY